MSSDEIIDDIVYTLCVKLIGIAFIGAVFIAAIVFLIAAVAVNDGGGHEIPDDCCVQVTATVLNVTSVVPPTCAPNRCTILSAYMTFSLPTNGAPTEEVTHIKSRVCKGTDNDCVRDFVYRYALGSIVPGYVDTTEPTQGRLPRFIEDDVPKDEEMSDTGRALLVTSGVLGAIGFVWLFFFILLSVKDTRDNCMSGFVKGCVHTIMCVPYTCMDCCRRCAPSPSMEFRNSSYV